MSFLQTIKIKDIKASLQKIIYSKDLAWADDVAKNLISLLRKVARSSKEMMIQHGYIDFLAVEELKVKVGWKTGAGV